SHVPRFLYGEGHVESFDHRDASVRFWLSMGAAPLLENPAADGGKRTKERGFDHARHAFRCDASTRPDPGGGSQPRGVAGGGRHHWTGDCLGRRKFPGFGFTATGKGGDGGDRGRA